MTPHALFVALDGGAKEAGKKNLDSLMTGFGSGNDRSTLQMVAPYSSEAYCTSSKRGCAMLLAAALQGCQLLANTQRREEDVRPTVCRL